ncbi:MAG: hypothetical protein ACXVCP_03500 [Bdellovibrio sp.]
MGKATVLEFPKEKSLRKRLQLKAQEQKAVLLLSIASVFIMTVFFNQWLVQGSSSAIADAGNRGVASFNGSSLKDVKWEHDLAKKFAKNQTHVSASIAETPTLRDELVFGFLEGKYGMKLSQGRIKTLVFIDAQAGEQPMAISNKEEFLTKYSEAFGLPFHEARLAKNSDSELVYNLTDSSNAVIGEAHFFTDDKGRVQTISFSQQ